MHCATQGTGDKDAKAIENLIAAARRAGVAHIIYVSIVGIDRIPLPYYKTKLRVEEALAASGLGHTVLRATQFHDLIKAIFASQRFSPVLLALRGVRFQPIDTRDVGGAAHRTDRRASGRARGRHRRARRGRTHRPGSDLPRRPGSRRRVVGVPSLGRIAAGYRSGANLVPDNPVGTITFEEYLANAG